MLVPSLITTALKKKLVYSIRDERGGSDKGHPGESCNKEKDGKATIPALP